MSSQDPQSTAKLKAWIAAEKEFTEFVAGLTYALDSDAIPEYKQLDERLKAARRAYEDCL